MIMHKKREYITAYSDEDREGGVALEHQSTVSKPRGTLPLKGMLGC